MFSHLSQPSSWFVPYCCKQPCCEHIRFACTSGIVTAYTMHCNMERRLPLQTAVTSCVCRSCCLVCWTGTRISASALRHVPATAGSHRTASCQWCRDQQSVLSNAFLRSCARKVSSASASDVSTLYSHTCKHLRDSTLLTLANLWKYMHVIEIATL